MGTTQAFMNGEGKWPFASNQPRGVPTVQHESYDQYLAGFDRSMVTQ